MAECRFSPRALCDLDEIFDYTVAQWGLAQALHYTDLIETACAGLAQSRLQSQDCGAIRPGYRRRTVERHVIYFQPVDDGIAFIRIWQLRMDPARHV